MKKVLVLEDEANIRSFVVINLKRAGYEAIEAETGEEALAQLKRNPDIKVALLDIMLPDMDGFEVCRRIRAGDNNIGIIMLTARTQEMDKVTGLMTGADDYVTKPFSPAELTARIDALYRRTGGGEAIDTGEISQPPFLLNTRNRTLEKNGQRVKLTQVEYSIMKLFMDNPGKALSREEILDPGGDPGRGVGAGLLRRAEDRGREHPPPAHQNRGRPDKPHVYYHGLGLWVQVGVLRSFPGRPRLGPTGGAALCAVRAFLPLAKTSAQGRFTRPEHVKSDKGPPQNEVLRGWTTRPTRRLLPRSGVMGTSGGSEGAASALQGLAWPG